MVTANYIALGSLKKKRENQIHEYFIKMGFASSVVWINFDWLVIGHEDKYNWYFPGNIGPDSS